LEDVLADVSPFMEMIMPECLVCAHTHAEHWADARDEEYYTTNDQFSYFRCQHCGVLFIDPVPRDELEVIYPANYYSFDEHVTQSLAFRVKDWLDQRLFRKLIEKLPHEHINVLDVGGGTGLQLTSLKKVDRRIAGTTIVDLDKNAGSIANQRGHEYFCGRFEEFTSDNTFEVILMLNLIEHVDNPQALLIKARSLLSPNGIVIIKTPNIDSLDARLFRHRNWGGYHCPRHWVLFNRSSLATIVKKSGLNIRHFHYTQGAPFWTTSVMYALSHHNWIRTSKQNPIPRHPLYPFLNMAFACIDFVRRPLSKTSQMLVILDGGTNSQCSV
jgi:2-polyprenyl-3-methyl-5-hydroxy-6-metoxy-1,4-benzoquinol methylase